MATRVVNRKYQTLTEFLEQWEKELKNRSLFLPAGFAPEDLTAEFKLDLSLPNGVRLGPFSCQVIHRGGDGSIGAQIPEIAGDLQASIDQFFGFLEEARDWYIHRGEVVLASEVPDVEALKAELEAERARAPVAPAAPALAWRPTSAPPAP